MKKNIWEATPLSSFYQEFPQKVPLLIAPAGI